MSQTSTSTRAEQLAAVFEIATRLGLPNSPSTAAAGGEGIPHTDCPWDGVALHGKVFTTRSRVVECAIEDYWHELGHALVAPRRYWNLRGWGQGMVYDGNDGGPVYPDAGHEADASAVGIWLHGLYDTREATRHAEYHSWGENDETGTLGLSLLRHPFLELRRYFQTGITPGVKRRVAARLRRIGLPSPWRPPALDPLAPPPTTS